ncbi:MAG: hypothetical protein HY791_04840 [Deltaproteobacteria bacterium]|nr:hypothetical protein [Deltaproteobacteria bacterium]
MPNSPKPSQLELFGIESLEAAPPRESEDEAPAPAPLQLTFFEPAVGLRGEWRRALASLDFEGARRMILAAGPLDASAVEELELAESLLARFKSLHDALPDANEALAALVSELPKWLVPGAHRRLAALAAELGRDLGEASSGRHLDLAGESAEATAVLRRELLDRPGHPRLLSHLGDAYFRTNDADAARQAYLAAALGGASLVSVADLEVADLEERATVVYEVRGDAAGWVPAVGIVEGVFARGLFPDVQPTSEGLRFFQGLVLERRARTHAERVAVRRALLKSNPRLFERYLETL